MGEGVQAGLNAEMRESTGMRVGIKAVVYGSFLLSGATALVWEVLWSRQFVTVFGNSSYAISVVLCAFMVGLGVGGWLGGRLADRFFSRRLLAYGLMQVGIAVWALGMPLALEVFREWTPRLPMLSPQSLVVSSAWRFLMSFAILFVPCAMMGATLPLLSRFCAESRDVIGRKVGLLYGLNTLGATGGCFVAGFWMVRLLGLSTSNYVAVGINLAIGALTILLGYRVEGQTSALPRSAEEFGKGESTAKETIAPRRDGRLLLGISFLSGMLGLSCQVLWVRFLAFFGNTHYAFTSVLGTYLLGMAIGSLIYRVVLARLGDARRIMAWVLLAAGWVIPLFCIVTVSTAHYQTPPSKTLLPVTMLTVLAPTIVMGMVFPLVCAAFADSVGSVGRKVGAVYAVNTAGSMIGSLIPVFVLIPALGIQHSVMLMALLYWAASLALFSALGRRERRAHLAVAGVGIAAMILGFAMVRPSWLCERAFLSNRLADGKNLDITFYREGRTGTSIIVRDKINGMRCIYINACAEVPTSYGSMTCFKLMGALGPLLHDDPDDVLMICFGGGVAAGAAVLSPDVKSLEIVDLESSVIEAARLFERENNDLQKNPKVRVTVDDGRNYIMTSGRKWPVIVSDSSHPKMGDSWVLYTQEFYRTAKEHLTDDGVFVQWVPHHSISMSEYKTIARTFQAVFPHASLWLSDGVSEELGVGECYTLLVATPGPLSIDVGALRRKLAVSAVKADLAPWGLDSVGGVLANFVCAEDSLREWVGAGPVNTDNLPYTQYTTKLSKGAPCVKAAFVQPLEGVWPYVKAIGGEVDVADLKRELESCVRAKRYFLAGSLRRALVELPEDRRFRKFLENIEASRSYLDELVDYSWESAPTLRKLTTYVMQAYGDPGKGIPLCRRAIELDPKEATARFGLGVALCRTGRWEDGIAEFRRGLALKPKNANGYKTLSSLFLDARQWEESITESRRALELDPENAEAYYLLGMALGQTGKQEELIRCLQEAVKLDPYYHAARAELGIALVEQGMFDGGMRQFDEAMRCNPLMLYKRCRMGYVLARAGKVKEAETQFSEVLKVNPQHVPAWRALAALRGFISESR